MEPVLSAPLVAALLASCAPRVHPTTAAALVATESSTNPYAIGVVGGALQRQPRSLDEALTTAARLQADGWNFSIGLAQINLRNLPSLRLSLHDAFEPCANLSAMQTLLSDCYRGAARSQQASDHVRQTPSTADQSALRDALSCYYSGNFVTGRRHGYVSRVVQAARPIQARPP